MACMRSSFGSQREWDGFYFYSLSWEYTIIKIVVCSQQIIVVISFIGIQNANDKTSIALAQIIPLRINRNNEREKKNTHSITKTRVDSNVSHGNTYCSSLRITGAFEKWFLRRAIDVLENVPSKFTEKSSR